MADSISKRTVRFNWLPNWDFVKSDSGSEYTHDSRYQGQFFYIEKGATIRVRRNEEGIYDSEFKEPGLYYCTDNDFILLSLDIYSVALQKNFLKFVTIEDVTDSNGEYHYMHFKAGVKETTDISGNKVLMVTDNPNDAIDICMVDITDAYKHIIVTIETDDTIPYVVGDDAYGKYKPYATTSVFTNTKDIYGHVTKTTETQRNNRYRWKVI